MADDPFTELEMKEALDGTFIRIMPDGRYQRRIVAREFLPVQAAAPVEPCRRKPPRSSSPGYRPFNEDEDQSLIDMSRSGDFTMREIGLQLQRSLDSVTARKYILKREGRL